MLSPRPTTFISYAYDTPEHIEWVRQLADDLISRYGVPVILDQYELEAGKELNYFMESSLEKADKVLVILTPGYKIKAGNRQGGAGFEYSMISQEMMATQVGRNKFIPVLRIGAPQEAAPLYLQGLIYHDMRPELAYMPQLHKLMLRLYDKPEHKKPTLGPVPDFNSPAPDQNLHELQQLTVVKQEAERMAGIVNSERGITLAIAESQRLFQILEEKSKLYKAAAPGDGFFFEKGKTHGQDEFRIVAGNHTVMVYWHQRYANTADDSTLRIVYLVGKVPFNLGQMPPSMRPKGPLRDKEYAFALGPSEQPQWKADKTFYTTEDLIKGVFTFLVEKVKQSHQLQ